MYGLLYITCPFLGCMVTQTAMLATALQVYQEEVEGDGENREKTKGLYVLVSNKNVGG